MEWKVVTTTHALTTICRCRRRRRRRHKKKNEDGECSLVVFDNIIALSVKC